MTNIGCVEKQSVLNFITAETNYSSYYLFRGLQVVFFDTHGKKCNFFFEEIKRQTINLI